MQIGKTYIVSGNRQTFSGIWRGYLSGSNRGPIFVRFRCTGATVTADALFQDFAFGPCTVLLEGTPEGNTIAFRLMTFTANSPLLPLDGVVTLHFSQDYKTAEGTWGTDAGTAGICKLTRTSEFEVVWVLREFIFEFRQVIRRSQTTLYTLFLFAVAVAAMFGHVQLSGLILLLLLIPAPFLFSSDLVTLIGIIRDTRVRKIGPVEFQDKPTPEIAAMTSSEAQQNVAFANLNRFLNVRSKVLLGVLAHGGGLLLRDFETSAKALGVPAENVKTTLEALGKTGCVEMSSDKIVATQWGQRFINQGLRFV
jgi:hypothetical protein